jgi:hypothetical protein
MSASRTVSPAEERLLDAALQQLFADTSVGAAARTTTRRSPQWLLVAMLLLGLGVTTTLMWQARDGQRDEAQDPSRSGRSDEVRATSAAEIEALPATTTHLMLRLVDPRDLEAVARLTELRSLRLVWKQGTLFGLSMGYHRSWSNPPAELLQPLAKLTKLEELGLMATLTSAPDLLAPLADHPTLHTLRISGDWPQARRRLDLALGRIPKLRTIGFHLVPVDADLLRELAKLPLTSFALEYCRGLDADGWQAICAMRSLQRLSLRDWSWNVKPGRDRDPPGWRPTPGELQHLRELTDLRTLELNHCPVDAEQLAALPDTLTSLHLWGNNLTPADFDGLRRFGNLRELHIDTRKRSNLIGSVFDDDPVPEAEAFGQALATLRLRSLHYSGALVPAVATAIGSQPDLRELTIDSKVLPTEVLRTLLANTQIETLRLRSTSGSIDATHPDLVSALANQTSLLVLEVPVIDLGDGRAATTLAQLPKLESLSLMFSSSTAGRLPTPSSLAPLAQSSTLREVELRIYTLAGAPPLAPQPLQQALGAKIQLHVANWGVVRR